MINNVLQYLEIQEQKNPDKYAILEKDKTLTLM